jgi:hypothetical protein
MESKKINQLATELSPDLSDLTIIGDPTTGISKKITLSQMASLFTGTVEEYANLAAFPLVGVADTIYIALDTNILYRWNTGTSAYVELSPNIVSSLVFNDANGFDGTINLVGSVATLTITTALTTGSVGFIGASGALLQDNANFFWDDTNNRLGLGTNSPTTALDVFGSGIIGRINGTSTNNAYLGFASAGTNKWSVGNVQSDHRFRIFSEANSAELISVLQTGEFGIGIANPTTKFHIDGAASALIANLDANVSVAKSISFRSDNSNRINLEVSGTESGSNAGANFFIRRYSDAGALIDTPLTITRSTGVISLATALSGTNATFLTQLILDRSSLTSATPLRFTTNGTNNWFIGISPLGTSTNDLSFYSHATSSSVLTLSNSTGAATFINIISLTTNDQSTSRFRLINTSGSNSSGYSIIAGVSGITQDGFSIFDNTNNATRFSITSSGSIGIGTNTPSDLLEVRGGFIRLSATSGNGPQFNLYSNGQTNNHVTLAQGFALATDNIGYLINRANADFIFGANNAEKMRITNGGFTKISNNATYVSTTSNTHEMNSNEANWLCENHNRNATPYGLRIKYPNTSPNGADNWFLYADDSTTQRFGVKSNGGISNFQANNTNLSDEKTKKEIILLESYWNKFKAIEIVKFKYIDQTHDDFNIGVIAQQVEKVAPEFIDIDGWNNKPEFDEEGNEIINTEEPLKSVYTSDLHHATIKVLQEAMAKIEILEEEVKLLKSK